MAAPELPRVKRREPVPWRNVMASELSRAERREPKLQRYVIAPKLPEDEIHYLNLRSTEYGTADV
jgi:hypothetical protein